MSRNHRSNPLHVAALCATLVLALVMLLDPLFPPSPFRSAGAVGGYDAVNVLGPSNFTGEPTWELIFVPPTNAILEFAYDIGTLEESEIIWAVTEGDVFYCDTETACDEELDWTSYAMSDTLQSIAVDQANRVLYVGTVAATTEILRCAIGANGCDEESDWAPAFSATLYASNNTEAIISAGGFIFAAVNGGTSSGPTTTYRCEIATTAGCDDAGDWTVAISSEGGRAWQFMFDAANDAVYLGRKDGSGAGHVQRCGDLATTGCDEDTDWSTAFGQGLPFHGITMDEDNEVIYLAFGGSGEGGEEPGAIVRCDTTLEDCADSGDWLELDTDGVDITSIIWEASTGFLFAGGVGDSFNELYRCDTTTDCDDFSDFELVSSDAGQNRFVIDTANGAIFSGGSQVWRCELATGCGAANELDQTFGVAYDQGGQRFFVADTNRSRVLVYDLSDGLDDGEEPVNVIGQTDFTNVDCNDGNGPGDPDDYTLCQPYGLEYDALNNRLFVGDFSNNRVMVFNVTPGFVSDGMPADYVIGQPDFVTADCNTTQDGLCGLQNALAYDQDNSRLFVGDMANRRVMVFDVTPATIDDGQPAINVIGTPDFTTDPGSCTINQATTCSPDGVALDLNSQTLAVSDTAAHRVTTYNVDLSVLVPNDSGTDGPDAEHVLGQDFFTTAGAGTSATEMANPTGVAFDSIGVRLFVADAGNHRVLQFDTTEIEDGEPAVDVYGQDDLDSNVADTTQSSLNIPYDVAYMSDFDYVAVADSENHRIMFFAAVANPAGPPTTEHIATDVLGQLTGADEPDFDHNGSDNSPNSRGFNEPASSVVDTANHRLFVTEASNNRVLVFNLDSSDNPLDRIADHVLGQPNFRTLDAGLSEFAFAGPSGLAYDPGADMLFVSDQDNNRVLVFDVAAIEDGEAAVNVLGQADFSTGDPGSALSNMDDPVGLTYDSGTDRLFVADSDNNRVLVFDADTIDDGEAAENVLQGEPSDNWTTAFDTASDPPGYDQVRDFAIDTDNQVLYGVGPGPGFFGTAYERCVLATGCDTDADWIKFSVGSGYLTSIVHDSPNDVLYAGAGFTGNIFRCPTATGCDVLGDWVLAADFDEILSMGIDTTHGVIYAGSIGSGSIYRCATSTGCDAQIDWTTVLDTAESHFYSIYFEPTSGVIYAGTGSDAAIYRCDTNVAGGCDDSGDWSVAFGPSGGFLFSIAQDTAHGVLYAAIDGNLLRCELATLCDSDVDWVEFSVTAAGAQILSITFDDDAEVLYAGNRVVSDGGDIISCDTSTGCDVNSEWTIAADAIDDHINAMIYDTVNGTLYAGSGESGGPSDAKIFRCDTADGCFGSPGYDDPRGLAYASTADLLFMSDNANRVLVFDAADVTDGEPPVNVLGQENMADSGPQTDQDGLNDARGVSHDGGSRLFVSDFGNNRVMVFNVAVIDDGEDAVNVLGQEDFLASAANATRDGLSSPTDVEFNTSTGYVVDQASHRLMVFDVSAIMNGDDAVDLLGQLDENDEPVYTIGGFFGGANNTPNAQGFLYPEYIALDEVGHRLFVTDADNNRVLVFELDADNALVDHTADFMLGQPDIKSVNGGTSASIMNYPIGVAYDGSTERLFVSEGNVDNENNRVLVFDVATITNGEDAVNVLGQPDFTTTGPNTTQSGMSNPAGLAVDSGAQLLYVSEQTNNRVTLYNISPAVLVPGCGLACDGPPAVGVLGQPDFFTADCETDDSSLCGPDGVAIDAATQRIFVGDVANNRVMVFDVDDGIDDDLSDGEAAVNVLGQGDFGSSGSGTSESAMNEAIAPMYRPDADYLYVSDVLNNRVMVFDVSSIDDGEDAIDAYGQTTFGDSAPGLSDRQFNEPFGLAWNPVINDLLVVDSLNYRVMVFGGVVPTPTPTPTPGSNNNPPPPGIGFTPIRIEVNQDSSVTDSRNVLVTVYATNTNTFTGTVDVLLSNDPQFSTFAPFRYNIPENQNGRSVQNIWPKTIAWDLCFGLKEGTPCDPGRKTVYARFYVNVPAPSPALTPRP